MNAKTIELINSIIVNAEANGADTGGTYRCNEDGLYDAMKTFIIEHFLEDRYEIKKMNVLIPKPYGQRGMWEVFQFVSKGEDVK